LEIGHFSSFHRGDQHNRRCDELEILEIIFQRQLKKPVIVLGARDPPKRTVAEAAVCGRTDAVTGQAIVAYVTLKGGDEGSVEMLEELRDHVATKIGAIAKPANIVFTPELPKTRSGKIMRRLLRDVAEHRALGDTTTLADPAVVHEIEQRATETPAED